MTRYNHTCYRIDDIDWSLNPLGTFTRRGEEVRTVLIYLVFTIFFILEVTAL